MNNPRVYMRLFMASAMIFGVGLVLVLLLLPPQKFVNVLFFYTDLSLFSFSVFVLLGIMIRRLIGQREFINLYFSVSLRQALWFCIILISSLLLLRYNLFTLTTVGFIVLTLVFLESYLLVKNNH